MGPCGGGGWMAQTFASSVTIIADSGDGWLAGSQSNFTAAVANSNTNSTTKIAPSGGGQLTFRR